MSAKRILIMGAAGRDFHNFNTLFRGSEAHQVVAFMQAEDEAALRAFLDMPELKQAMQDAGVVGAPNVTFLQSLERVDY